MKTKFQESLLAIACLLCSIGVQAHDFELNGIYYNITSDTDHTVAVTHYGDAADGVADEYKYTGAVAIPESVTYNEVTYDVTTIGNKAFYQCAGLTEITIPNSIISVENNAFDGCSGLTEVTIPSSITSLGDYSFANTYGLKTINFNADNCSCNVAPFAMSNATTINIGESVKSIPNDVFGELKDLANVFIPAGVSYISSRAFFGSMIKNIAVDENNAVYDSRENCNAIIETATNKLILGSGYTIIPEGITSIDDLAFVYNLNLTSITIPSSVTTIGEQSFLFCDNLTEITCLATTPPTIGSFMTFFIANTSIPVYVPAESLDNYKAQWGLYLPNILAIVKASSLTLDKNELNIYVDDQVSLTATVLPDNTSNKKIVWSTSNSEVASVDENGLVTALTAGTTTITATTTDGSNLSASCEVTVEPKKVKLTLQNSYYNNVIFFLTSGTEQQVQIVDTDPMFVLNTVMYNEEDVTDQLVDGFYTTPAIVEDAVLNISYQIPTAQNAPMHNSHIKAYGYRGDVVVTGCEKGDNIAIYDVDGILVRTIFATSNTMRIAMPTDAVYVVRVADTAVKVAL